MCQIVVRKHIVLNLSLSFLLIIPGIFLSLESAQADDVVDLTPLVGDLLNGNFHAREHLKIMLDGSEAASGLSRITQLTNELVYLSPQAWRVRRDLPFSEETFEFLMTDKGIRVMNKFNHPAEPNFSVPAKTYLEILASPLRFATEWKLVEASADMNGLLRLLRKGPAQDATGNKMELEEKDGDLVIKLSGKILQDGKTNVNVEGTWQVTERGKITDASLRIP